MDQDSHVPEVPAAVRKSQAQSVSQLQHISVPPEALTGRPPPNRSRRNSAMKTYLLIGVMTIVVAVGVFFLVRALQ